MTGNEISNFFFEIFLNLRNQDYSLGVRVETSLSFCHPGSGFWSLAGVVVKSLSVATEWQINFYRCGALTLFVGLVILLRYRRSGLSVIRKSGKKGFRSISYIHYWFILIYLAKGAQILLGLFLHGLFKKIFKH